MTTNTGLTVNFPEFSGVRCLMMPYIQGDSSSVPDIYSAYADIIDAVFVKKGDIGFLTIDESVAKAGKPHRGAHAKFDRALHTEAGVNPNQIYCWGHGGWGQTKIVTDKVTGKIQYKHLVTLDRDTKILLANNLDNSCAVWDCVHENTSTNGDIGEFADEYPYQDAFFMKSGEVHQIGILTPHESMPVTNDFNRQFLRIISSGVHGREEYFTQNPLVNHY